MDRFVIRDSRYLGRIFNADQPEMPKFLQNIAFERIVSDSLKGEQ